MTGQELKSRVLDERERVLCLFNPPCRNGYCPTYDCLILDKAKALTDRQWNNIAKEVHSELDFIEMPCEIMKRRVKHDQARKNQESPRNHQQRKT